jgi:AcrR family transcriptional regulator
MLEVDREVQREAILDAAIACITDLGYDRTSLEVVAERAGLPVQTISLYFSNMADVRLALFALWGERLSAWICYA